MINNTKPKKIWLLKPAFYLSLVYFILFALNKSGYMYFPGLAIMPYSVLNSIFIISILGFFINTLLTVNSLKYSFEDQFIAVSQHGCFKSVQSNYLYSKVQNISISQDFIERLLGLYTVSLTNPAGRRDNSGSPLYKVILIGFSDNCLTLPGLTKQEALDIAKFILAKANQN